MVMIVHQRATWHELFGLIFYSGEGVTGPTHYRQNREGTNRHFWFAEEAHQGLKTQLIPPSSDQKSTSVFCR
ncbi:hypothetical protein L3X38_002541 [Prunus dulcis]|uniref:Uncharacterized protein n=1 Tax=Prunus dulcis TaxID=3755 RepID=A0AAD4WYE9_PRUDU|nr:hypothetical protein L3X38_002541 [Prunus dulcis]